MQKLPEAYLRRMQELLGEEYEDFLRSYDMPPKRGLRFNMKKARQETIEELVARWDLRPVPWCREGWYYEEKEGVRPGKSPYHEAGVFYIQEPSAMIPAERAEIREEHRVLDLCAAPGGKSTQAAQRAGILVSNEYIKKRAQILSSNIERMGLRNVIVTSASPAELAEVFPEYFDRIIVDAPCSGEGMMRRDETAIAEWSEENVALCVERQREILREAFRMLAPGGRLVYSTCTFEPEENRLQAEHFLSEHDELVLLSQEQIFPHRAEGEGHYCAVFRREGEAPEEAPSLSEAAERLRRARVHILRCGVEPGELIKGKHKGETRYEPSHAEAMAMGPEELSEKSLNLLTEELSAMWLRGESLNLAALSGGSFRLHVPEDFSGYLPVCFDGYPLGFGKLVKGVVKNHYPKGLRRN